MRLLKQIKLQILYDNSIATSKKDHSYWCRTSVVTVQWVFELICSVESSDTILCISYKLASHVVLSYTWRVKSCYVFAQLV